MSPSRSGRLAVLLVAVAGVIVASCIPGDVGFTVVIDNPCDREVIVEYWHDRDPGPEDSLAHLTEWTIAPGASFEIGSIGEDFEVVVSSEELDYVERQSAPEPDGTITFNLPASGC